MVDRNPNDIVAISSRGTIQPSHVPWSIPSCNELRKSRTMLPKSFTSSLALGWTGETMHRQTQTRLRREWEKSLLPASKVGISFNFSHRDESNFAKFTIPWNFINAISQGVTLQNIDRKNIRPHAVPDGTFLFFHRSDIKYTIYSFLHDYYFKQLFQIKRELYY